ncbi:unnamed protein product [Pedinophyceae sp. YPF-701]|nr:unnamed protein product [Pedinophyceae sp. YPF-701]
MLRATLLGPLSTIKSQTTRRITQRNMQAQAAAGLPSELHPRAATVLTFWFGPDFPKQVPHDVHSAEARKWFFGGTAVDDEIRELFADEVGAVIGGGLTEWRTTPLGKLARIIVADQFTRNVHRGSPKAYAGDPIALQEALGMMEAGEDKQLRAIERSFAYLPLEHSESLDMQDSAVAAFEELFEDVRARSGLPEDGGAFGAVVGQFEQFKDFAVKHREVVARWGRFPGRNQALGRESTPEETRGLADGSIPKF